MSLVNEEVGDGERATVLSITSMVGNLGGAALLLATLSLLHAMGMGLASVGVALVGFCPLLRLSRMRPKAPSLVSVPVP